MANIDDTNQKLELLRMARQLLNEEYINRRAEDHNQWLADCDDLWRTKRMKLPYPPFAPYPSESDIVTKAAALYAFINPNDTKEEPALTQQEINIANRVKSMPPVPKVTDSPWTTYLNPITETTEPTGQSLVADSVTPTIPVIPAGIDRQEIRAKVEEVFKPEPVVELAKPKETTADPMGEPEITTPSSTINTTMKNLIPNFWRSRQETKGDV